MKYVKINGVAGKVEHLLTHYPHLRDDDNKLIANFWHMELKQVGATKANFLELYADKRLTNAESITVNQLKAS